MRLSSLGAVGRICNAKMLAHSAVPELPPVLSCVRVAVLLAAFVAVAAMGSAKLSGTCDLSASSTNANASLKVHLASDWLQVFRIHAAVDSAEVIKVEAIGYWSSEVNVRDTMSQQGNTVMAIEVFEPSVPAPVNLSSPQPAAGIRLGRDSRQYAFLDWYSGSTHFDPPVIVMARARRCASNTAAARSSHCTSEGC